MSRSNPNTSASTNPSKRFIEWGGGDGSLSYYDKEKAEKCTIPIPFTFLFLDELNTMKGWHDPSQSAIYSNEVKDLRVEELNVRSFKGGEIAKGLYSQISDKAKVAGAKYVKSIYIAFYDESKQLVIGNLQFKGTAAFAWGEFVKAHRSDIAKKAIVISGTEKGKKGITEFQTPIFELKEVSKETDEKAILLDTELQIYLKEYLGKKHEVPETVTLPNGKIAEVITEDANKLESDDLPF